MLFCIGPSSEVIYEVKKKPTAVFAIGSHDRKTWKNFQKIVVNSDIYNFAIFRF
jgi:hypothetical protein